MVQKGFFRLKSNKSAVPASCRFSGRAPIRIFRCKILDDAEIYLGIVRVNPGDSVLPDIDVPKLVI